MTDSNSSPNVETYRSNERASVIFNHAIVVLMMMSLAYSIEALASRLFLGWQGGYMPVLSLLISLEAIATWRTMRRWSDLNVYGFMYWAVEWVVLVLLIKLCLYVFHGFGQLFIDLPLWQEDFLTNFFTGEMLFVIGVSFIVWLFSGLYARDLAEMEGDEALLKIEELGGYVSNRGEIRRGLVGRVFGIGFVIVLCTAFVHIDLQNLGQAQDVPILDMLNVVLYFLLALVLFSKTHFDVLRASWAWDKVPVSRGLSRSWGIFSILFLVLIGILAFLLPTRYSLGFLTTLGIVFSLLFNLIYGLVFLVLFPIMALIGWIMGLFKGGAEDSQSGPITPKFPFTPAAPGAPIPWLEVLKSVLFWVVLLLILGYALRQYLRQNQELASRLGKIPFLNWLTGFWRWLAGFIRGANQKVSQVVQTNLQRLRARRAAAISQAGPDFLHLRRLSARQRVLFFYQAFLRRGSESGLPRQAYQTPYEYLQTIRPGLSEVEPDLEGLTDAFIEARYTRQEVTPEHASIMQRYWQRVKKAFRNLRSS